MRILFDTYAPDVAPEVLGGRGLIQALNCTKDPAGYRSMPALANTAAPALGVYDNDASGDVRASIAIRAQSTSDEYNVIMTNGVDLGSGFIDCGVYMSSAGGG